MPVPRLCLCCPLHRSRNPRGQRWGASIAPWPCHRGGQRAWQPSSYSLRRQPHHCIRRLERIAHPSPLLLLLLPLLLWRRPPGIWISSPDLDWKLRRCPYCRGSLSGPPLSPPSWSLLDEGDSAYQTRRRIGGISRTRGNPLPCPLRRFSTSLVTPLVPLLPQSQKGLQARITHPLYGSA